MYCGKGSRTKEHICEICSEAFSSKIFLKIHKRKSHSLNAKCSACDKNVRNLERHTKLYCRKITRSNKKEYSCELCVKLFSSKKLLRIHTNKDHLSKMKCRHCKIPVSTEEHDAHLLSCCIEGNVKCEYCEIDFNCSTILLGHQTRKHGKGRKIDEFLCEICLKTFSKKKHVTEHKKQIHEGIKRKDKVMKTSNAIDNDESLFKCEFCDKTFQTNLKLDCHRKITHKQERQKCGLCGKTFLTKRLLKIHIQNIHDQGEKNRIACKYCDKIFIRYNSISRHIRDVHEKKRDHKCYICQKTFKRHVQLTTHIESIHNLKSRNVHGCTKKFECDVCGKTCDQLSSLIAHKNFIHGMKTPQYKCEICGKLYHGKSYLNAHVKQYHEEGHFECNICKKVEKNRAYLDAHVRFQHKAEIRQCEYCNKCFSSANGLKSHYSRDHKNSNEPTNEQELEDLVIETSDLPTKSNEPPLLEVPSNEESQVDPLKIEVDIKPEPCEYDPLAMSVPIISKIEPEE